MFFLRGSFRYLSNASARNALAWQKLAIISKERHYARRHDHDPAGRVHRPATHPCIGTGVAQRPRRRGRPDGSSPHAGAGHRCRGAVRSAQWMGHVPTVLIPPKQERPYALRMSLLSLSDSATSAMFFLTKQHKALMCGIRWGSSNTPCECQTPP